MELQAVLMLCGLGVAGAAVLLLMGLFSVSGTSYEEAVAQQRRAATELLALAESKNKPKKNAKKINKKLAKKEKYKESSAANNSEPESEAPAESGADADDDAVPALVPATAPVSRPHVEFSPPTVLDVSRDMPPNVKIRKRGKDPKVKPILLNKEDPSCVSDPSAPPTPTTGIHNHFEEIQPKDELELMHSALAEKVEKKEEVKEVKAKPAKAKAAKAAPAPAPEPTKEEAPRERRNSGDATKEQRKAGKKAEKKPIEEVQEVVREEVVPPLNVPQPSELTTEKLLRQAFAPLPAPAPAPAPTPAPAAPAQSTPARSKGKKKQEANVLSLIAGGAGGVTVSELVRLMTEAALSRTEIQILTDALLNKQHDPLPQHSEWTEGPNDPMQKLKKQLADKEKALTDETEASQALHAKLKELRASLNAERSRATAAARAADEAAVELHSLQARLQRLADDNHALAQDKMMLQSKLGAEGEAERAQRVQMEMHIQRLSEAETALLGQLNALQAELQARALEAGGARCEAAAARDAALLAQQHASELAQQLQEANRVCAELDAQRQNAMLSEQATQQELRATQEKLNAISELQAEVQRVTNQAQHAESNTEKVKDEMEKQKQQLSSELVSLREQLASLKEQLATREVELAEVKQLKATAAPAQNGLPPSNMTDQHKAAELSKVEAVIESLRGELAGAQLACAEQKDLALRLRTQLEQYQDKNNELRTKNWKVMEALQSTERALQARISTAAPAQDPLREAIAKAQESQYAEVASVLRAACPAAAPATVPSRAWLEAFAAELSRRLATPPVTSSAPPTATSPTDEPRLRELRAQNDHLQGLVDKYKKIIDDTEGVLSRLQHNVTSEEQRWARQLADKQRELDDLRLRTVTQMQNKIDALQAELRQAQSANHNHSFADAERHTEERLLGALSDKHKLDSLNGPIQVGLDEK